MPFNSFRWDTTEQGHNYWYSKSMYWILYLANNMDDIDEDEKKKYEINNDTIRTCLHDLLNFYCLEGAKEEDLANIEPFKEVKALYEELSKTND
jgi:hypothetical protein